MATTIPNRMEMRFPAELRAGDVFAVADSGPLTYVSSTVKPSQPKIARITVKEHPEVLELDVFDETPVIRMISRGSVDPIFADGMKGTAHLYVPLTDDPGRCGECGDGNTPTHITIAEEVTELGPTAVQGDLFAGLLDLTTLVADNAAKKAKPAAKPTKTTPQPRRPKKPAKAPQLPADRLVSPQTLAELGAGTLFRNGGSSIHTFSHLEDGDKPGTFHLGAPTPAVQEPPADLFTLLNLASAIADKAEAAAASPTAGVIPLADATWGMYGKVSAAWGPDGSVTDRRTGYVIQTPRIYTNGIMGNNKGPKKAGEPLLHLDLEIRANGSSIGLYCLPDATFTVMDPPAEHPLKSAMLLCRRMPFADLRPGDVFHIWDERDGARDLLHHGGFNVADLRPRYHVQSVPRKAGETAFEVEVLVDGEGPAVPMIRAGMLWTDVDDPRKHPWHDARYLDELANPVVRCRRALADRLGPEHTVLADHDGVVAVTGDVYEDTVTECFGRPYRWWLTHERGVDLFRPRDGDQYGVVGGRVGAAGDDLDQVRATLAAATIEHDGLRLPRDLEHTLWEKIHGVLRGMGVTGGSRKREAYEIKDARLPDLWAFIAGGPAPKHERTTVGWVRTPDKLAADVVTRFAELDRLPRVASHTGCGCCAAPRVLEPSAGDGSLVAAVYAAAPHADLIAVEPDPDRADALRGMPQGFPVHGLTLEEFAGRFDFNGNLKGFDLIVMNPPYSAVGNRGLWVTHVALAWGMLAEGGRLVAILPGDLTHADLRRDKVLDLVGADRQVEQLPPRSFRQRGNGGTDIDTWVLAATKPVTDVGKARQAYAASLYRPAKSDPVRVAEVVTNRKSMLEMPVQASRDWGGDFIARYVGQCIVCTVSCWSRDDGDNDPRGVLGLSAVAALRAAENDMQGPDVCLCYGCADSGIMLDRGLARARTMWTEPEPEPLTFIGVCDACGARTQPCPAEGPGETWKSAEQWIFLALKEHKPDCPGKPGVDDEQAAVALVSDRLADVL